MGSKAGTITEMVNNIQDFGCRITIPCHQPSPLVVLFDGDFDCAAYIPLHPATLYIYGMNGHISVTDIVDAEKVSDDIYTVTFGRDHALDMMVKILK